MGLDGNGKGFLNEQQIPIYHCPSYAGGVGPYVYDIPPEVGFVHTHYLGVNGTDQFKFDGILHVNSRVKQTDVTNQDGTSTTFLVGERPPDQRGYWGWWFAGAGPYPFFAAIDVALGTEERMTVGGECTPTAPQSSYREGNYQFDDDGDGTGTDLNSWHFWSGHQGGAHFLFADGHVGFISYTIDKATFRALGSYKGREVVDGDF